jgi:hypothetical protein
MRRSNDNITVVMVAFDNFFDLIRSSNGAISNFEHSNIELKALDLHRPPYNPEDKPLLEKTVKEAPRLTDQMLLAETNEEVPLPRKMSN